MAQFTTDFADSAYTPTAAPGDWTKIWETTCNWTIETESSQSLDGSSFGDQVLKCDATSLARNGLVWDDAGSVEDVDIKARCRAKDYGTAVIGLLARAFEDSNGEDGYWLYLSTTTHELGLARRVNGAVTVIATYELDKEEQIYLSDDVWYCIRFQVNGTDLKGKIWRADEDEPGGWQIEETDSNVTAAGGAGLVAKIDSYCDWFSVGTGGDAPEAFPATEADARLTQETVEVLREGDPDARLTQAVVEVLRDNISAQSVVVIIG